MGREEGLECRRRVEQVYERNRWNGVASDERNRAHPLSEGRSLLTDTTEIEVLFGERNTLCHASHVNAYRPCYVR